MAIAERITSYTVWVAQTSYLGYTRVITLKLESGTTVYIGFPKDRPADWLQFPAPGAINLYMTADQYDDVYHILQTEDPAFCTAIDGSVLGLQVGAVHTQLDLSIGEPTGEGYQDHSLEALIVRAQKHLAGNTQT
ncbi:MAG: hypothetical protein ACM3ML_36905 [Micromonosporaceae bacterium]